MIKSMRTIHREIVVGLVVSKDHHIVLGMKDPARGGVYADCWHIPGGGIEPGETHLQALQREMAEELGLDISEAQISLLDDKGQGESQKTLPESGETVICKMNFYVYRIMLSKNAADVTLVPGDDIVKAVWVDPAALGTYNLTPPSQELFKRHSWIHHEA